MKKIILIIILMIFSHCSYGEKIYVYNSSKIFHIQGRFPETNTFTVLSPMCMFKNNYGKRDCKAYINLFLDLQCSFSQKKNITDHNGNPDYYLYMSPEYYYSYDSRLNIYDKINRTGIYLAPGLACQSNNACVWIASFTLSYKNWNNVPITGNNVLLNCSKFSVYSYI
jgi:hypothetical protein